MEPYASQLSGSSLGQPLYDNQKRGCTKAAVGKGCAALVSVLLLASAVGLGLYFVGDDDSSSGGGGGGSGSGSTDIIGGNGDAADLEPGARDNTPPGGQVDRDDLAPDAPDYVRDPQNGKLIEIPDERNKPLLLNDYSHTIKPGAMPWPFDSMFGGSFLFFEAQRSGAVESDATAPGNRIPWRGDQLLKDGNYVGEGLDLVGGHYEAGNRLKITFASAYFISRTAWTCLYQGKLFDEVTFEGKSMLYWCKREMKWAADWMLKAHIYKGSKRPNTWRKGDQLAIMSGKWPEDFDCYQRAELIPDSKVDCPASARASLVSEGPDKPAGETAATAAAAMAAVAALFQADDKAFAQEAYTMSQAMYDYAIKFPKTGMTWSKDQVNNTYPMKHSDQTILFAEAMFAYVHSCKNTDLLMCNKKKAASWTTIASTHWDWQFLKQRHNSYMISFWGNPDYDTALLLTMATGNLTAEPAKILEDYIETHVLGDGTKKVSASPKGMRYHASEDWAFLRTATASSFVAATYATFPGVSKKYRAMCYCYARSQLGYIMGDTGTAYVHGFGTNYVNQVHHRDSVCTMEEGRDGSCVTDKDTTKFFAADKPPNAYVVHGAIVGGPNAKDEYVDDRSEYKYTEVAMDYNTLFTMALAATTAADPDIWSENCAKYVGNYPWPQAEKAAQSAKGASPAPNVGSSAAPNDPPSIYDFVVNEPASGGGGAGAATTSPAPSTPDNTGANAGSAVPSAPTGRRLLA